jgi:Holliday junction resolvase RusA-like endonuclease
MKITINQEPIPKARARTVVRNGRVMSFTPKATSEAEASIRAQIAQYKEFYAAGVPLAIKMWFYISKPPSISKKRTMPVTRPDIDNYCKLVLDACNKYLWADDSQIVSLEAFKRYAPTPCIVIEVDQIVTV